MLFSTFDSLPESVTLHPWYTFPPINRFVTLISALSLVSTPMSLYNVLFSPSLTTWIIETFAFLPALTSVFAIAVLFAASSAAKSIRTVISASSSASTANLLAFTAFSA